MKLRFPLYAKILLWFFMNLAALGVAGLLISGAPFRFGLDSLLAGRSGDRIEAVSGLISSELRGSAREKRDEVLKRFSDAYHVRFFLFQNNGMQIAGEPVELPHQVRERLVEPRVLPPPRRDFPQFSPNPPPPPDRPPGYPRPPLNPDAAPNPPPQPPPQVPAPHPKMMLRTVNPVRYWVLVRFAGPRDKPDLPPEPLTLVAVSDSINGGGLFFDPMPWLAVGAGAILFSALLWLPLVRGITRSIRQMTHATEQIAEGRFDVRVNGARRDELGSLGGAINRMAARLAGFVGGQKRFLGDIAHELCSPLARAQMALGILEQRGDTAQRGYVDDVREEIELMSNLVNELLSFSKAALGAQIKLEPVALRPLVEKAVGREAGDGARIEIAVAENLRVKAEPELLLRSLANLVRNAVRYAGNAGPIIISARSHGGNVALTVADSGPGVPSDALAQVFDPFYRLDPSRARETGGVGLGLAIVKTCTESCSGTVTARNREPCGLEVIITLRQA